MTNDSITIRKAKQSDLQTLLKFEQAVVDTERPFDPTLRSHPNFYYDLKLMIDDPLVHLVVAEANGELIASGYALIQQSNHFLKHDRHAYLGFMYVVPMWRGKNINQMIIEELKSWSLSKGITELRLEVYVENLPALRAYEKAGFSKLLIQMRMGIEKE